MGCGSQWERRFNLRGVLRGSAGFATTPGVVSVRSYGRLSAAGQTAPKLPGVGHFGRFLRSRISTMTRAKNGCTSRTGFPKRRRSPRSSSWPTRAPRLGPRRPLPHRCASSRPRRSYATPQPPASGQRCRLAAVELTVVDGRLTTAVRRFLACKSRPARVCELYLLGPRIDNPAAPE
jgi:hypothetical protein